MTNQIILKTLLVSLVFGLSQAIADTGYGLSQTGTISSVQIPTPKGIGVSEVGTLNSIPLNASIGFGISEIGTLNSMSALTTIITHGYTLDLGEPEWADFKWQFSMADAVASDRQIILLRQGRAFLCQLNYAELQAIDDDTKMEDLVANPDMFQSIDDVSWAITGNVVFVFDWSMESDINEFGFAEAAGEALAATLLRLAKTYPWLLHKLHFIGHSRGTVVNSEAIQRLIYLGSKNYLYGIGLDKQIHMTTLDAHPAGHWQKRVVPQRDDEVNSAITGLGVTGWAGGEYSTFYIDNFYETTGTTGWGLIFKGLPWFRGSLYNFSLDTVFNNADSAHSLVHSWYYGTVDTRAEYDEFGSEPQIKAEWYANRNREGFYHSFNRTNNLDVIKADQESLTPVTDYGHLNDRVLIANGDFSKGAIYEVPGWQYQGGSGEGFQDKGQLKLSRGAPEKIHDWFYVAKEKIYFYVSTTFKSPNQKLHIWLVDQDENLPLLTKTIKFNNLTSFQNYELDVKNYTGTTKRIKFQYEYNEPSIYQPELSLDNVGFEKYTNVEATIVLNSGNSSKAVHAKQAAAENDVYLQVYDQAGNHSGQIDDTTWVLEIPGSYYSMSPDSSDLPYKTIYLPRPENGQEYAFKIESKGQTGSIDFKLSDYSNGENAAVVSFDSIQINTSTVAQTSLSQVDSNTTLQVDNDGDGQADVTLSSTTYLVNYKIIASSGSGGSITPADTTFILNGDSIVYQIVPDSGYAIADVKVDSIPLGKISSYAFNAISKNHTIHAIFEPATGIKQGQKMPLKYFLDQNYPNPFNPATEISFGLEKDSQVHLEIYNSLGQKVATLIDQKMAAGVHKLTFNANGLSSGIYYYSLRAGAYSAVRKMLLIR